MFQREPVMRRCLGGVSGPGNLSGIFSRLIVGSPEGSESSEERDRESGYAGGPRQSMLSPENGETPCIR